MVLGISEDFTSDVTLDSELKAIPSSGLYLNSGVHPSINLGNLLDFLPIIDFTVNDWSENTDYGVFTESRNRRDIVSMNGNIYQSLKLNTNVSPTSDTEGNWLETNNESLRLKMFIFQVKDRVYSDLSLTKRLVNNQFLYENAENKRVLDNDYHAWVIEPKGSDYVSFRINQLSIQKDGTDPINVYVINQNTLLDTITITPNNGEIAFRNVDISLVGKGAFKIAIDSQEVYSDNVTINPLKFDGFVAYAGNGTGDNPETASYTYNNFGFGLGMNISAFMDGKQYIDNNLSDLSNFVRATFELMVFEMYLYNSNNRSNRSQRIQLNDEMLIAEVKNMNAETIVRRYYRELKRAKATMQKTFDTSLNDHDGLEVTTTTF